MTQAAQRCALKLSSASLVRLHECHDDRGRRGRPPVEGKEMQFRGAPAPSGPKDPWYPVLTLKLNELVDVTFLEEDFVGVWQHWAFDPAKGKDRSYACEEWRGECRLCDKSKLYWAGYA